MKNNHLKLDNHLKHIKLHNTYLKEFSHPIVLGQQIKVTKKNKGIQNIFIDNNILWEFQPVLLAVWIN